MSTNDTPIPRPTARVVLIDERDRVLLFHSVVEDQEIPHIWITPGGGLKPGESFQEAALRELWEETGLDGVTLGPCVWTRRHVWQAGSKLYDTTDHFFLVRTPVFEVTTEGFEPLEAASLMEHRWWRLPDIASATDQTFVPRNLAELLRPIIEGTLPDRPIDVGP